MSKETDEGITKIAVTGFKSLAEECAIDIRPLTILAGANSSGKSSIMQPLLMLKQTMEALYDPGPLLLHGPNVQFTLAEQFFSKLIGEERVDRFQIRIDTCGFDSSFSTTTTFRKRQIGIELVKMMTEIKSEADRSLPPERFILYPKMPREEIKSLVDQGLFLGIMDVDAVMRSRCFLGFESPDGYRSFDLTANLESHIFESIHLPGLRDNPERIYKLTGTGPQYPGTFENYVASIIHDWQNTKDSRLQTLVRTLRRLGLTGQIHTQKIGDIAIEIQVGLHPRHRTNSMDMVSIADVGIGCIPSFARFSCLDCRGAGAVSLSGTAGAAPPPPRTGRVGASVGRCGETRCSCRRGNT